jgi:hypothetical protein
MARAYLTRLLGVGPAGAPADWEEAVRLVEFHGLEGLAVARARESAATGAGPGDALPPDVAARWEPLYHMQGLHATLLLESADRARAALAAAGVASLLFKGAALVSDGTYPDAGARRMDDVDLLVPLARAALAVETLSAAGFSPVTPWSPERVGWAEALTFHDGAAPPGATLALDVHWRTRYDRLRFGGEEESTLWGGADLERGLPAPEPHLVLGAEHLLKHLRFKTHLAAFGDLARLAGRARDWDRVAALAGRSRLAAGISAILAILAREMGSPVPSGMIRRVPGRGLAQEISPRSLAGRVRPVEGRLAGIAWRWRLLGAPGRVAADLVEAVFPSAAWLQARYGRSGLAAWGRYATDVALWSAYRGRSPASPHQELFDPRARE